VREGCTVVKFFICYLEARNSRFCQNCHVFASFLGYCSHLSFQACKKIGACNYCVRFKAGAEVQYRL